MRRPIVFVTDYGRDDAYAAALTGAAWRIDRHAVCVEGTHGVPPGDVIAAAYHLKSLALAFDRSTRPRSRKVERIRPRAFRSN